MYNNVYVVNTVIQSISGKHTITEADIGLAPGTLPPEEVATLGSLIVVDKKQLAPFERIRARAKRTMSAIGVRVGVGTVVMPADYDCLKDKLEALRSEFYECKQELISEFQDKLGDRASKHPKYAALIKKHAPTENYIERRLSFHVDTLKLDVSPDDPRSAELTETLSRDGNDIRQRLVSETSSMIDEVIKASIEKDGRLVTANLRPLRNVLLPKLQSFQLLDSAFWNVANHLSKTIDTATKALGNRSTGQAYLDGNELAETSGRLVQLRTASGIEQLLNSQDNVEVMPSIGTVKVETPKPPEEQQNSFANALNTSSRVVF